MEQRSGPFRCSRRIRFLSQSCRTLNPTRASGPNLTESFALVHFDMMVPIWIVNGAIIVVIVRTTIQIHSSVRVRVVVVIIVAIWWMMNHAWDTDRVFVMRRWKWEVGLGWCGASMVSMSCTCSPVIWLKWRSATTRQYRWNMTVQVINRPGIAHVLVVVLRMEFGTFQRRWPLEAKFFQDWFTLGFYRFTQRSAWT